jgi:peptidyl-prolyl cis-trans isomerase SurA
MSDSVLDHKHMVSGWAITATTPLFAIGDSVYNATHWVNYANMYRYNQDGTGAKPWDQVREEWVQYSLFEFFKEHLEEFTSEFSYQMTEFKEGNLFFEIMQNEVWNKAQTDTAGLIALYEKNKKNYLWKKSADAVLFFCSDLNTANTVYNKIKGDPAGWRTVTDMYSEKVIGDSSRYEWEQIPNLGKIGPRPGLLTIPQLNPSDNTSSFAYIINVYNQPAQRSFQEARGMVINDFQTILEQQWDESLRKKYPVTIDPKVLAEISK